MSNGEKMHNALHKALIKDLEKNWALDWDDLHKALIKDLEKNWALDWDDAVQSVYDGFIEDLQEDIRIDAKSIGWDDGDGDVPIGCEVFLVPYISDAGDMPEIGKPIALSEILITLCLSHGEEEANIMLEKSLTAFRAKAEEAEIISNGYQVAVKKRV